MFFVHNTVSSQYLSIGTWLFIVAGLFDSKDIVRDVHKGVVRIKRSYCHRTSFRIGGVSFFEWDAFVVPDPEGDGR